MGWNQFWRSILTFVWNLLHFHKIFFGECPIHVCLFVQGWDLSFAWRIKSVFAEFPVLLMRHEAIEMVCAHVPQSREPSPHHWGVLGDNITHWLTQICFTQISNIKHFSKDSHFSLNTYYESKIPSLTCISLIFLWTYST